LARPRQQIPPEQSWEDVVGVLARYSNREDLANALSDLLQRLERATPGTERQPRQVAARPHVRRPVRYRLTEADMGRLVELYRSGATGKELAAQFGIGLSSAKRLLHEHGIHHVPKLTTKQAEAIFASYRAGVGPRELSTRYGVTERAIKYLLQKHGMQRRRGPEVAGGDGAGLENR
jgi:hypothetical protein